MPQRRVSMSHSIVWVFRFTKGMVSLEVTEVHFTGSKGPPNLVLMMLK